METRLDTMQGDTNALKAGMKIVDTRLNDMNTRLDRMEQTLTTIIKLLQRPN